jgi:hypothetical protein
MSAISSGRIIPVAFIACAGREAGFGTVFLSGSVFGFLSNSVTVDFLPQCPLARACLVIREKQIPDDWHAFNDRSRLGGSLLGQKKYAEAEPRLLSAYEGMQQREDRIPAADRPRLKETLQRLVQLYETTGRTEQAAAWKQKLAEFEKAESEQKPAAEPQ